MQPIDAYLQTADRARHLFRLHDGLVNNRRRGIRSDWKASFCGVMHWPKTSSIERVDGSGAIVVLRQGAALVPDDFAADTLDELLRASLAVAVSALDRYVHERVTKRIVAALKKAYLTTDQQSFLVPAVVAVRAAQAARVARRTNAQTRPANEIRKSIQDQLHKRPFQSWRDIEYAFELVGVSKLAAGLQVAYGVADFNQVRNQLNAIVQRRNYIVHEGDIPRHQRGGSAWPTKITKKYAEDSMDFLDLFVFHLEQFG